MSHVVVIKRIAIQNANAVAGLTYGFPAITHFLGFVHALSRQLPKHLGLSFSGVGVICHNHQVHAKQPKGWGDYVFALTRNPVTKEGNTAPIIEEGRMNLDVSLVIELTGLIEGDEETTEQLQAWLNRRVPAMRLAGGQIINQPTALCESCFNGQTVSRLMRSLMPGFALIDRHEYLKAHYQQCVKEKPEFTLLDAWCDFAALKYGAEHTEATNDSNSESITWKYRKKPKSGYLVPIMTGYCAISDVFPPGEVSRVRDTNVPAVYAEAAYGIGEWLSPHRIKDNLNSLVWRYHYQAPWYVATAAPLQELPIDTDTDIENENNAELY